jgi:RHS repeat-associated protein
VTRIVDASQTNSAKTVDYGYDDLNRLIGATSTNAVSGGNYVQSYAYDPIGNTLFRSDVGAYTYPGTSGFANPHAVVSASGTVYAYNNDGTLASRGVDKFTWNYRALLLSAFVNGATSTYAYDPDGARTRLTESATATIYASDWYSTTGGKATKHLFAGGMLVATIEGSTSTAVVRFIHPDHLTGSSVVTSSTGTLAELLDYHPYGTTRLDQKAGSFSEMRKFAGQLKDELSGLNYVRARYYEPALGRFLSEDPAFLAVGNPQSLRQITKLDLQEYLANPQHMNSYSYAFNNPLAYTDEGGKFAIRTLGVALLQSGKAALSIGMTYGQASLAGAAVAVGQPQIAGFLAAGALGQPGRRFR